TKHSEVGLVTSSTAATRMSSPTSTDGFVGVYAAFFGSDLAAKAELAAKTINAGPIDSSLSTGCSVLLQPVPRPVNPHEGEPSTGEPYAGKPPVRFGGRGSRTQSALPTSMCVASITTFPAPSR